MHKLNDISFIQDKDNKYISKRETEMNKWRENVEKLSDGAADFSTDIPTTTGQVTSKQKFRAAIKRLKANKTAGPKEVNRKKFKILPNGLVQQGL